MRLRRVVHGLGKKRNHVAGLDAQIGEIEISADAAVERHRVIFENFGRGINAVQSAMKPDFAQTVIVARLDLRLQFKIHRHERVTFRIGDMNFRRQIMRDGERAFDAHPATAARQHPRCQSAAARIPPR